MRWYIFVFCAARFVDEIVYGVFGAARFVDEIVYGVFGAARFVDVDGIFLCFVLLLSLMR